MSEIKEIVDKETIEAEFKAKKAMIFKNSKRCPVSAAARKKFFDFTEICEEKIEFYIVDVIENNDLSREIENRTGVVHQSPQVIFLEEGKTKCNKSHYDINHDSLRESIH